MGFYCNRGDCTANKYFECSALVQKNPATGKLLNTDTCPFFLTTEQAYEDKEKTIAKLREHGREDLIQKYWGVKHP